MKLGATGQKGESLWAGLFPPTVGRPGGARSRPRPTSCSSRFKLDHMRDEFAGNLSGGQRKLLEMARALMADPKLVMLDEPMAGVNPALKQSLQPAHREGPARRPASHRASSSSTTWTWSTTSPTGSIVMAEGRVIAEGTPTISWAATRR